MRTEALCYACFGFLLSGCVAGLAYSPPAPPRAVRYQSQGALAAVSGSNPAPPLDAWWVGFQDPQLVAIIRRVLAQNLDLAAAEARVRQARAVARRAGAIELPQGGLDASVARQRQSLHSPLGRIAGAFPGYRRDQTLSDLDVGASWELDLAGGLKRAAEAMRDEAQAAEALRTGVRVSVAAEAADAYFRTRGAQRRIALNRQEAAADAGLLALLQARLRDGVARTREVAQASALLAEARARRPPLQIQLQLQLDRLDVLMGEAPGAGIGAMRAGGAPFVVPGIDAGEGPRQLLRRRPDVIAAERRLAAANALIGVALSAYYPQVSLAGLLGFERLGSGALLSAGSFQAAGVVGLHWRLFDFGRVDAKVAEARGRHAEALAEYRQAMLRATEDVEDAIATFVQLRAQCDALQAAAAAHEEALAAARREYRAGSADLLVVLDEDRRLLAVRDELERSRTDTERAAIATFRALGGGWTPSADAGGAEPSVGGQVRRPAMP